MNEAERKKITDRMSQLVVSIDKQLQRIGGAQTERAAKLLEAYDQETKALEVRLAELADDES